MKNEPHVTRDMVVAGWGASREPAFGDEDCFQKIFRAMFSKWLEKPVGLHELEIVESIGRRLTERIERSGFDSLPVDLQIALRNDPCKYAAAKVAVWSSVNPGNPDEAHS
jgi:hypothetical protein